MLTVPEAIEICAICFIILVVLLEKNEFLRVNKWLRTIEIQGSFKIDGDKLGCILDGPNSTVNQALFGISAIRNMATKALENYKNRVTGLLRIEGAEVNIKIVSTIVNIDGLKNAEFVPLGSGISFWNVVLN